jgi:hypothetical protein
MPKRLCAYWIVIINAAETIGSSLRTAPSSKQLLAAAELISSAEHLVRLPYLSNRTLLRVGPLELDLLDRTAKRGDRQIDLRPREFHLLKYMMQRSDKLLTRETLLKEVWNYRVVPETNLVDVHIGRSQDRRTKRALPHSQRARNWLRSQCDSFLALFTANIRHYQQPGLRTILRARLQGRCNGNR